MFDELCKVVQTGKPWINDSFTYQENAGDHQLKKIYAMSAAKLKDGVVITWNDVTATKTAQQNILQLNEELRKHTNQLEIVNKELEAFSYSISHDLHSPLRSIEGFSRILLEDFAEQLDATGENYLQRIIAATENMSNLIDALLTLSYQTRKPINPVKVNLSNVVQSVIDELKISHPQRRVQTRIAKDIFAHGDPEVLHCVMENLFRNAWKFTSTKPLAKIEFGQIVEDHTKVYYVKDNGVGFNMKYIDQLFTPFQRLHPKNKFPGSGVGLATVYRIIQRHNGRIWAESSPNKGATFYFKLK